MSLLADKILSALLSANGIAIGMGILALAFGAVKFRRVSQLLFAGSLATLWILSTPLVAGLLLRSLEGQYQPVPVERSPVAEIAVVLGGSTRPAISDDVDLTDAGDRILHAIDLYRQKKVTKILLAGGNVPWKSGSPIEAVVIANFLRKYGVDERAILIEGRSRNTHENAVEAGRILKDLGTPPVLLVTSAAHMPRAVASFRKAGIEVIPSPTDYHISSEVEINILEISILDILPSASALYASSEAIREWAGYGVYWYRDWL